MGMIVWILPLAGSVTTMVICGLRRAYRMGWIWGLMGEEEVLVLIYMFDVLVEVSGVGRNLRGCVP